MIEHPNVTAAAVAGQAQADFAARPCTPTRSSASLRARSVC